MANQPGTSAHRASHSRYPQYPPALGSPTSTTCSRKQRLVFGKKRDIVTYLHRAYLSPVPSTCIKEIDTRFLRTWPGLTSKLVRAHLPKSLATAKGHLRTARTNQGSTRITSLLPQPDQSHHEMTTDLANDPVRQNECFLQTVEISGKVYSNQTGPFPHNSSRGTKYIMVLHDCNSYSILAAPFKNKSLAKQLQATTVLHFYLKTRGLTPKMHFMDNECPGNVKYYLQANTIKYQIVPPHVHHTNAAEK